MQKYLEDLRYIKEHGTRTSNRTGTDTLSVFGMQTRYDLSESFPAVTTKKLAWKAVVSELLWFIEGSGDERRLCEILHGTRATSKKTIWTDNAEAGYWRHKSKFYGDLGRVYGNQWRKWQTPLDNSTVFKRLKNLFRKEQYVVTDQLANLIDGIKKDPDGRRHLLTAWNPGELNDMALPPCHILSQFYVNDGKLSCQMYQRSNDFFLGCPFNIASYSLLTHMIAQVCGLQVGEFIHVTGDAHIYVNHLDQVDEQISRTILRPPQLVLNPDIMDIDKFTMADIELIGYTSHASIKADMAV